MFAYLFPLWLCVFYFFSGCDYVLHSTSQLLSHKRKHERREIEFAYRRFKDTNSTHGAMLNPALLGFTSNGQQQSKDKCNSEEFERRSNSPTLNDLSDSNSLDAESFSKSGGTTFNQFEKFDSELGPFARSLPSQPVGGLDLGAKMEEERLATVSVLSEPEIADLESTNSSVARVSRDCFFPVFFFCHQTSYEL